MKPNQQTIHRWRKISSLKVRFLWCSTTTDERLYTTVDVIELGEVPEDFDGTPMDLNSIEILDEQPVVDPLTGDSTVRF